MCRFGRRKQEVNNMNREEFPMLNTNYIYLDNGATTWKPKSVVDKINELFKNNNE